MKACACCGDSARGRRQGLSCCRDCLRLSVYVFGCGVEEMRRINRCERELAKAAQ